MNTTYQLSLPEIAPVRRRAVTAGQKPPNSDAFPTSVQLTPVDRNITPLGVPIIAVMTCNSTQSYSFHHSTPFSSLYFIANFTLLNGCGVSMLFIVDRRVDERAGGYSTVGSLVRELN
jgi:hypothetical protein